eukprot:TRINITY_DN36447_c0_g1_i1.p5 TRINITY_DN36447_c0_g1~~TRINITY_DN36447_c0_g1_i1.p5  ORF type:complete len:135 (-),score=25.54 TRINITY_DN36447_c0_g1_i1:1663-2067(-)
MIVASSENLVHQIAIAGHENEPLGVFVQAADGENSGIVANKPLDIVTFSAVRGADNAYGLVECDEYQVFFGPGSDKLVINFHRVAGHHLVSDLRALAVNEHLTLLNVTISLAARTQPAFADVFVEAFGGGAGHD